MTTEQESGLVPTLQLLLGDCTEEELHNILASAFGDRVNIILPNGSGVMSYHIRVAMENTEKLISGLSGPPLGKLACENLQGLSQRVITALHTIRYVLHGEHT
jgi:hypothetical protein